MWLRKLLCQGHFRTINSIYFCKVVCCSGNPELFSAYSDGDVTVLWDFGSGHCADLQKLEY